MTPRHTFERLMRLWIDNFGYDIWPEESHLDIAGRKFTCVYPTFNNVLFEIELHHARYSIRRNNPDALPAIGRSPARSYNWIGEQPTDEDMVEISLLLPQ